MTHPYLATLMLTMTAQAAVAHRLVDPTRPANAKAAPTTVHTEALRLEAILVSDGARVAIVNGKVVRAGDKIGAARIDEVMASGIRFTRGGQTHTAHLNAKSISVRKNVVPAEEET